MFKRKPFFIVFEGVEGCGKSYQSRKLFLLLKKKGLNVVLTREPGGTGSAEKIRDLILKNIKPTRSFKEEDENDGKTSSALGSLGLKPKPAI